MTAKAVIVSDALWNDPAPRSVTIPGSPPREYGFSVATYPKTPRDLVDPILSLVRKYLAQKGRIYLRGE